MEMKMLGWDFLESVLKRELAVDRNLNFAIPPSLLLKFLQPLGTGIELKREEAH